MERELAKKEKFNKKPDLLLIDGGKGQLSAVVEVLDELDMTGLVVAGLAKEHEWLYLPESDRRRSSCRRTRPRCISSSGSATKRTASPSPITASGAQSP